MMRKWILLALGAGVGLQVWPAQAVDCSAGGYSGVEAGQAQVRDAKLNPQGDFSKDQRHSALYSELNVDCAVDATKLHVSAYGERMQNYGESGSAQDNDGYDNHGFIREAYLSLSPNDSLFVDVGKKDIRNGQFFFVSPLDFLQNPGNYSSRGVINAMGVSWRDSYREGSVALQASWFNQYGTVELAAIPQLANESSKARVAEWTTLQRTNGEERYYAAYTSSLFEDFNPRFVLLGGENFGAGLGTSGFLTDDWILNLELAARDRSDIRETSSAALAKLQSWQLPSADEVFVEQQRDVFTQFAAGLRYATENNLAISVEYLFQDQGLDENNWDDYFDFLDVTEQAYRFSGAEVFRDYQLLFAQETDNTVRRDLMLGRQYLMAHVQRDQAELQRLSWETSTIYNIEDQSYALNLHLSSQLSRHFEVYVGGGYLGGQDRSEFGRLGTSGVGYAGVRAIW
ncbi:hypothetical protein HNE05_12955 [Aquipseudomonas campi]|uniref:Porin n=1 Tax=Aquipseudomonas campi TaxID=2731681 RepID=A0A6M8FA83_9GAMM|nr:hypothetical protein [Pseudomonas campi]QKE64221.1 hypothetical protein HNE05_12955 [Pseudomonas campi]